MLLILFTKIETWPLRVSHSSMSHFLYKTKEE
jgi:hypothetical protein